HVVLTPKVITGGAALESDVKDVKFERGPDKDRIVVAITKMPAHSVAPAGGKLRLRLDGARLPESLQRTLDVTAYHGVLRSISAWSDATKSTIIEIDRSADTPGEITTEDDKLVWSFP